MDEATALESCKGEVILETEETNHHAIRPSLLHVNDMGYSLDDDDVKIKSKK
jgi:hypothetical protein